MIGVQEAEEKILAHVAPIGTEARPILKALGLFASEEVVAPLSLPPFDHSVMDGYAVRSSDLLDARSEAPVRLKMVGSIPAGSLTDITLNPQEAVQIATGAPVPPGADTIVILEEAKWRDGWVVVDHPVPAGRHIVRKGEDIKEGEVVLPKGHRIRPAEVALLAALGISEVRVFRPPKVAILATGSELVEVNQTLRPGAIRDSNSLVLECYLQRMGVPVLNLGIIPDEEKRICAAFEKAAQCDVILSSGGVSVGRRDLVRKILVREFDFREIFWRVRMKPGKPLLFGLLDGKPLFGLPGNPISCAVCFVRFVGLALRKMLGDPHPHPERSKAQLGVPLTLKDATRVHFLTARITWNEDPPKAVPTPHQGSGMLTSMVEGNGFIVVPEGVVELPCGAWVEVMSDA